MAVPTTLALISLENADLIGDALGGASRDMLLAEFRERVGRLARPADRVMEVSPGKACVLLNNVEDANQIELAGAKLTRLFRTPVHLVDKDVRPEVHAAFVPPSAAARSMDQRIRIAESGLREARRRGNVFVIRHEVSCEMEQETLRRTREVEKGLARGEFLLFFQPKVHAGYGNVVGAEGLMRWLHPEDGLLGPDRFLPFLDDPHARKSLCWMAVKSAIAACAGWPEGVGVAVNVPPDLVCEPELQVVIGDALNIYGLAPGRVTLEVTEEVMLDDPEAAMATLRELRDSGIRIAIDDFGTGYSSLAYLRDLALDELKIDRAFVTDLDEGSRNRDIIRAVVALSHAFSMRVVAEGVEDAATAEVLKALGCDLLQGYHFGKPMPPAQFEALLTGGAAPPAAARKAGSAARQTGA